jgi:hypothetical protein
VNPSASRDRYEPLPGLLEMPGFLIRKLGPRGRRILGAVAALLLLALAAGIVFGLPAVNDTKAERAAAERQARERAQAAEAARLEAEQRLVRGSGTPSAGLAAAVETDARARVQSGELDQGIVRAECERYPRGARGEDPATNLASSMGRYSCLAVTADAPRLETQHASSLGYPYRALVDFPSGRFTYCKVSGRPGEGSLRTDIPVKVPAACGG